MNERKTDVIELQKKMVERGIGTRVDLAKKSGIDRNTIGLILSGKKQPTVNAIRGLAAALDLSDREIVSIFFTPQLRDTQLNNKELHAAHAEG